LGDDDRVQYLMMVSGLATTANISKTVAATVQPQLHLENMEKALMQLHNYLAPFDQQLAAVYARDSQTSILPPE
jgi:phage shock protein A